MKALEKEHNKRFKAAQRTRGKEPDKKFLTTGKILDRHALTKGGRQKLALQYGSAGDVKFSLSELSELATRLEARRGKFEGSVKGVIVQDLVRISLPIDKARARTIRNATLYKFDGNILYFRVTASGESKGAPSHYVVKVRLEDWEQQVRDCAINNNYTLSANRAAMGHVSFDCGCGRHQFWYRYLAHIGGFAVEPPAENVFPKIRNKHLKGCACKHVMKVLMVLQSPTLHVPLAKEMERQAKETNFSIPKPKAVAAKLLAELEKAGDIDFKRAQAAFQKKSQTEVTQRAMKELEAKARKKMEETVMKKQAAEMVAKKEIERNRNLQADIKKGYLATLQGFSDAGILNEQSISKYAERSGADKAILMKIATDEGLL